MTREYAFQKKVTDEQAAEIIRESEELPGLKKIVVTEDHKALQVSADNEDYQFLMERILNICSRVAGGQWIEFRRFVYDGEA